MRRHYISSHDDKVNTRDQVMDALRKHGPMTCVQISDATGLSPNKIALAVRRNGSYFEVADRTISMHRHLLATA